MAEVSLSVPAKPDFVHIPRSVIAGVAASLDLSYDQIEDLRLAVDESCAYLLAMEGAVTTLSVRITSSPSGLDVVASLDGAGSTPPPPSGPQQLIWHILGALTDGASLEQTDNGPAIRLTKRIPT